MSFFAILNQLRLIGSLDVVGVYYTNQKNIGSTKIVCLPIQHVFKNYQQLFQKLIVPQNVQQKNLLSNYFS